MNHVEKWIKEKCSKCEREKKCKPYSVEMLICILQYANQNIKRREEVVATKIKI